MKPFKSFVEIIAAWPGIDVLANDMGVDIEMVIGWRKRDSIAAKHWKRLLQIARKRNIKIRSDLLIDLAAKI